jgi:hypothetical protein
MLIGIVCLVLTGQPCNLPKEKKPPKCQVSGVDYRHTDSEFHLVADGPAGLRIKSIREDSGYLLCYRISRRYSAGFDLNTADQYRGKDGK